MSGDIKRNIYRHEVKCKCGKCDHDTIDSALADVLQEAVDTFEVRYHSRVILMITSGDRCIDHNRSIGSNDTSWHIKGRAVDHYFIVSATGHMIDPDEVASYYEQKYPGRYGIGRYDGFTHLDTRAKKARWGDRK